MFETFSIKLIRDGDKQETYFCFLSLNNCLYILSTYQYQFFYSLIDTLLNYIESNRAGGQLK